MRDARRNRRNASWVRLLAPALVMVPVLLATTAVLANYRNLRVLPTDIAPADLEATMLRMGDALGVSCGYCHVQNDASSDAQPAKDVTRRMMRMTIALNRDWFPGGKAPMISCQTCHRGETEPPTLARRGPRAMPMGPPDPRDMPLPAPEPTPPGDSEPTPGEPDSGTDGVDGGGEPALPPETPGTESPGPDTTTPDPDVPGSATPPTESGTAAPVPTGDDTL